MISVNEATKKILECAHSFGTENIPLSQCAGRVLAEDIIADRDYPPFNRATMDGFALRIEDWKSGKRQFKIVAKILAGESTQIVLKENECYQIMTGASVPLSANVIIKIELSTIEDKEVSFQEINLFEFQNIAQKGEDSVKGTILMQEGVFCYGPEMGVLAAVGCEKVKVAKKPSIVLISTGTEVKKIDQTLNDVQIRESNSYSLEGFLNKYQIKVADKFLVPDVVDFLKETIKIAAGHDIIIITGGVSAGDADFVPQALDLAGFTKIFHKVEIKPGKPIWFGKNAKNCIVFALPGNPHSVQVAWKIFIEPYIRACFKMPLQEPEFLSITESCVNKTGYTEIISCVKNKIIGKITPIKIKGSGDITASIYADGIAILQNKDANEGESIPFFTW